MFKKILCLILIILSITLVGCSKKEEIKLNDAQKFKEEYESLNNETNSSGKLYRSLEIDKDNPFVYKSADEIVDAINNGETFAIYFGFKSCPWCRSILPTLIKVSKDLKIKTIYYVDVLEIRDTMEFNEKGDIITTKEGSKGYYKLLELLDSVLEDYTLTNDKGKSVKTGEKRIYAPNIVSVINGEAKKLDTGISEQQTDGYMELTEEMLNETYDKLKCVLECLKEEPEHCEIGC